MNKMHNNRAEQLPKKPKPRITWSIAAMTHEKDNMGHMRQYQGLLVYKNSGITTDRTEEPLKGWIVAETTRAMDGGDIQVHGGPLWTMLPTTMTVEIYNMPFRFEQDPTGEPLCLDTEWKARRREQTANRIPVMSPSVCLITVHEHGLGNRRGRRPGHIRI